jgi:F1F0 ATPase subunit 2
MTVSESITLCLAACAGLMLGGIFFGGLWWTVRKGVVTKQPGLWFLGSMIVRMTVVMAGFYFVSDGQWDRLLSSLVGFIAARTIIVRLSRPCQSKPLIRSNGLEVCSEAAIRLPKESHHAT